MYDVAVIGLGPVGATFANLLARYGLTVAVLERESAPYALPRAVHFDAECMRVFDAIGVAHEVAASCHISPGMKFVNASGQLLVDWPRPREIGAQGWHSSYRFHQPDLERILRARLAEQGSVSVQLRSEVYAIEESASHVQVKYEDLSCGKLKTIEAAYVVGADGARSLVRRLMGSEMTDLGLHERWLVFDAVLKRPWSVLGDHSVQFCDPARPATYVRGIGDRRRFEIMLHPGEDAAEMARPETVWSLIERWMTPDDAELERAVVYTFHALVAQRWRRGRLILAGDSAHQTPPFLGQGLCAGVRDAANLAWKLTAVCRHGADGTLLDTYQDERAPHASEYIKLAVELGRIIQARDPEEVAERDRALAIAPRMLRSLSPRLGESDLRVAQAASGIVAPQPMLAGGQRLDVIAGQTFAILARPGLLDTASAEALRERMSYPLSVIDDGNAEAMDCLKEFDAAAIVIRPDRYVFGTASDLQQLLALVDGLGRIIEAGKSPAPVC
ncbi:MULTISPECIES: bifunctional 3-(3-hydroxy-phenyl)propionate/3-hydroxycinnamic acid hydroxylase [unclassified Paraburkholderia]|uniref:bifunctional 3-(3-hydroxy-phenyl)propionate/3-hydroxycinnamic acid hydroxylase MhpA n=1 Tax=unclassified Paraburkholderia TaxID=2615204 RepID=UPI001622F35A|nr:MULTISPECIES: bifunctional 3-(3-hydroxy-phenyl)propionate/3-hydroxycinnamic acid hydroxylase [unclassified Paraburkholderia]MBB5443802.1 3-(3-hydroxy-phenyl)propionate hydroxylase [Paraburkholderia sp. WSM4177]MBB5485071.1 3-(3-hydroxy-phenyl)propionate hydroxylase [Paraburkholderia sp. WSM4180]